MQLALAVADVERAVVGLRDVARGGDDEVEVAVAVEVARDGAAREAPVVLEGHPALVLARVEVVHAQPVVAELGLVDDDIHLAVAVRVGDHEVLVRPVDRDARAPEDVARAPVEREEVAAPVRGLPVAGLVADGVSPLVAKSARQIDLANQTLPKLLDALAEARTRTALPTCLC